MYKFFNILMFLIIFIFFNITKYYSSEEGNLKTKNYNRSNIDQILKNKIKHLPILANDTNNVIEFNNSFEEQINGEKKEVFGNLLKENETQSFNH